MANYLTAVIPRHLEPAFRDWIAPHLQAAQASVAGGPGSGEHLVLDLPGTTARLHHVARGAVRDAVSVPHEPEREATGSGAVFHGYAQSSAGATTVFGAAGLGGMIAAGDRTLLDAPAGQEWDGSYVKVAWRGPELQAHTDFFRLVPMAYTAGAGLLAVSDSWQVLVRLRTELGLPVTVPAELAAALSLQRIIAAHPVDGRTLCSQVRMVGVGARLHARLGPEGAEDVGVRQEPFGTLFGDPGGSWAENVRAGAIGMASVLRSHADSGLSLRLSLSGGADSRAVLAALRRADPGQDVTVLSTTNRGPANVRDAVVVRDLAETLGLVLGARDGHEVRSVRYPTPFQAWMTGTLGLHDRLGMIRSRALPGSHYTLTGHGAGIFKSTYGWRPFAGVAADMAGFDPHAGPLATRLAEDYLVSVGVDPAAPDASEWHYIAWRNSLHGGRSTLVNLLSAPPLMQRRLASLAHVDPASATALPASLRQTPEDNGPRPNTSLTSVMMCLLDPELASLPHDEAEKDIDARTRQLILSLAGGPVADDELTAVRAYGRPSDVESGIAETFLSLSASWGQRVGLDHEAIAPLVEQGGRIAEGIGLADWYGPVVDQARENLAAAGTITQQDGSFGKLLPFLPLAGASLDGPVPGRAPIPADASGSLAAPAASASTGTRFRRRVGGLMPSSARRRVSAARRRILGGDGG
jgi:hypothetical protein